MDLKDAAQQALDVLNLEWLGYQTRWEMMEKAIRDLQSALAHSQSCDNKTKGE